MKSINNKENIENNKKEMILQFGFLKYNSDIFISNLLSYKNALLNNKLYTLGIVVDENLDFDTICLIYACLKSSIKPFIIDCNADVDRIIIENNIPFVITKLKKRYCVPTININDKARINEYANKIECNMESYYRNLENKIILYKANGFNYKKDTITLEEIKNYNNKMNEIKADLVSSKGVISSPLYLKQTLLHLNGNIVNGIHTCFLKKSEIRKNIKKMLTLKPDIMTFDEGLIIELYVNEKYKNVDLSFIKYVITEGLHEKYLLLLQQVLATHNCEAEFINNEVPKVKKIK